MAGYTYLWEFHVRPEQRLQFMSIYGPDGDWVALFRKAPGYVGTLLLEDHSNPNRFVTVDRWHSEGAFQEFRTRFAEKYGVLDERCEEFTLKEQSLGIFTEIDETKSA